MTPEQEARVDALKQNTRPSEDGVPVETYGYEETYNQALEAVKPLIADLLTDITAEREYGARERKAWTAFAIVDPASNNYTYDGFFMTKKQAVGVLRDRYQGMKGLTIIEVDVVQALTPPTK